MLATHGSVERCVPEGEDAAVRGHFPVALAIGGGGDAGDGLVEVLATYGSVERCIPEGGAGLVTQGLVGTARLAAQRAAGRQGRGGGRHVRHHIDHERRGVDPAAEAHRRRLAAVVDGGELPRRTVASRGRHDNTELGAGPEGVDDRVDRDLDQGIGRGRQVFGVARQVARDRQEVGRLGKVYLVGRPEEARGDVLLLAGTGAHLGDGGLEIDHGRGGGHPQVQGGRPDDGGVGGHWRGLEPEAVRRGHRGPVPCGRGGPGVATRGEAGGRAGARVEAQRGHARFLGGLRTGGQRSAGAEPVGRGLVASRPLGEVGRIRRLRIARAHGSGAVVEQDVDTWRLAVEHLLCLGQGRGPREPDGRERCLGGGPGRVTGEPVEDEPADQAWLRRNHVGHIQVQELQPSGDDLWVRGVDVPAVHHVGEHLGGLG